MNAIEALTQRVSGKVLVEPAPTEPEVRTLLRAAVRAPDHGRLRPWRFTILRGEALRQLGELMARAFAKDHPEATPAQLDRERGKPLRAPLVIVVAAKVKHDAPIPAIEQQYAAAAAAQNISVAAFAMGYGCAWKTGEAAYSVEIKAAFGLGPADAIVGFLYLGSHGSAMPAPAPLEPDAYLGAFAPDLPPRA